MQIGGQQMSQLMALQKAFTGRLEDAPDERSPDPSDEYHTPEDAPPLYSSTSSRGRGGRDHQFRLDDGGQRHRQFRYAEASADELKEIRRELEGRRRDLRQDGITDQERPQFEEANRELSDVRAALGRMREVDRERRWASVAGDRQLPGTYEAYFKASDVSARDMQQIIQVADDVADPQSERRIGGNSVRPLMRGDIWQTKSDMLRQGAAERTEINAEYYELSSSETIDHLREAAQQGSPVRVLLDPGRLAYGSNGSLDASSMVGRLNTVERLREGTEDTNLGVALYANSEQLGGRGELMHRKILRVGEDLLVGGMNANHGSGENIDFALQVRGPAARELVNTFRTDVEASRGASVEQIYGDQIAMLREDERPIVVDGRAVQQLTRLAGDDAGRLFEAPPQELQRLQSSGYGKLTLSAEGRNYLADRMESMVTALQSRQNVQALGDVSTPAGPVQGNDTVAIGSSAVERQALTLHAIESAEKFIKVSAFVVTDDIAQALIQKKRELEAAGRPFQVQVLLDPGRYQYGGTPNEAAFKLLEDEGVPVRWSVLDRTTPDHDRKNHSKLIITDRMLLSGSTNFSAKGMRNNWELSDVVYFRDNDARQDAVVRDYDRMWEREGVELNSIVATQQALQGQPHDAVAFDDARTRVIRSFLRTAEDHEKAVGARVQAAVENDPQLQAAIAARVAQGESEGYAIFAALGEERMKEIRESTPAWRRLMPAAASPLQPASRP